MTSAISRITESIIQSEYRYVGVILVRKDGSVLAQHRDNKSGIVEPDTWSIVGGRTETEDVNLPQAGCRELKEESGYIANPDDLSCLGEDKFYTPGSLVRRTIYWAWYDEKQPIDCLEGQEIRFISHKEITCSLKFCDPCHQEYLRGASEMVFTPHRKH